MEWSWFFPHYFSLKSFLGEGGKQKFPRWRKIGKVGSVLISCSLISTNFLSMSFSRLSYWTIAIESPDDCVSALSCCSSGNWKGVLFFLLSAFRFSTPLEDIRFKMATAARSHLKTHQHFFILWWKFSLKRKTFLQGFKKGWKMWKSQNVNFEFHTERTRAKRGKRGMKLKPEWA